MTTLWILVAIAIGVIVCFVLLCKGRTPCLCIDEAPKIITDELPGIGIELINCPKEDFGRLMEYKAERFEIKYSSDKYAGLVIHDHKLFYKIGKHLDQDVGEYLIYIVTGATVENKFIEPGALMLMWVEYDCKINLLTNT